jgi:hypothetical protein
MRIIWRGALRAMKRTGAAIRLPAVATGILCALFAARAEAKSPPPGAGVADVPANILLMLDTSGSMGEYVSYTEQFSYPYDIATDSQGNLYVGELYGGVVVYDRDGQYVRKWGSYSSESASRAGDSGFYYVYGVATDSSDNVYVCDLYHNRVQVFTGTGTFVRSISLGSRNCYGIEISPSGTLYVVYDNGNIGRYSTSNGSLLGTWSVGGAVSVAFDSSGRHYVLRYTSSEYRIYVYDSSRTLDDYIDITDYNAEVRYPTFITLDPGNNIYISESDHYRSRVYRLNKSSGVTYMNHRSDVASVTQLGGSRSSAAGSFRTPFGVHYDAVRGDVLIADFYNHRVQSFSGSVPIISGAGETRLDVMKKVVKKLITDSGLLDGAHFGLVEWNSDAWMRVPISAEGASEIYNMIDTLDASGGTVLDRAMELALPYFLGDQGPRNPNITCQKNIIIVVSDGYWENNSSSEIAHNLSFNHQVYTYAIGFQVTGDDNYVDLSVNGGTYPESPLFAENWEELYEQMATAIRNAVNSDLTFAAPTIMPDIVGDDHILQATFRYKSQHQWKGRLKKFALDDGGNVGGLAWDAGERLNATGSEFRNLWTVSDSLPSGVNNFTVANMAALRPMLEAHVRRGYSDETVTGLIDFVRGKDVYGETIGGKDDEGQDVYLGDRWKLADIYHSRALVVGAPAARSTLEANPAGDAYYRASHGYADFVRSESCGAAGSLCSERKSVVYVGSNGGMLHAFDNLTGDELWGFIPPTILPALKDMMPASGTGTSSAIFAVDGTPAVKDVFDGERWRTVLVIGLRQGGGGYSVLDVTNPLAPSHLFTIGYDSFSDEVRYWNAAGVQAQFRRAADVPSGYDVRRLGETWSDPVILRLPLGPEGTDRWVAVAGGGYNGGVNANYGDKVFFFDVFAESPLLAQVTLPDLSGGDGIQNSAPAQITAITPDTTAKFPYAGAMLYIADQQGALWKIDATNRGHLLETTRLFDMQSTSRNQRLAFQQTVSAITDGRLYHIVGTGNVLEPDETSTQVDNRLFAAQDAYFPEFQTETPHTLGQLRDATGLAAICPDDEFPGWQIQLSGAGKILSPATVFNHSVMAPVYRPEPEDVCAGGSSSLLELRLDCGNQLRETLLGSGISTRAVVYNNKIYLGISSSDDEIVLPEGFVKSGNLIVGTPMAPRETKVTIESWWEGGL